MPLDSSVPLAVDMDGTLIKTDLLVESFLSFAALRPLGALAAVFRLFRGKAALKATLAAGAEINVATLPLNRDLYEFLKSEKAKGRRIYLASASDRRYVERLAEHLGLFDGVFASDGTRNLAGKAKARVLCEAFGSNRFDYAGDSKADLAVWADARQAFAVNASSGVLRTARKRFPDIVQIGLRTLPIKTYARALRVHQWLKNLLILVPAAAAHQFGAALGDSLLAFACFSLCASSVYLLNDLLDLTSDRDHPTKSRRPFAAGTLPLVHGIVLFPLLLAGALGLGLLLSAKFVAILVGYYALTMGYSFYLKRQMMLDVLVLACLYGARLVAGGVAGGVVLSPWLQAFAIFFFLSLALIKRSTELIERAKAGRGNPTGRGYRLDDLPMLQAMAAASGYVAALVMALYINSPAVVALYREPDRLWALCIVLVYWISRILLITHRGEMHDDPVVFAATDRTSLFCVAFIGAVVMSSI